MSTEESSEQAIKQKKKNKKNEIVLKLVSSRYDKICLMLVPFAEDIPRCVFYILKVVHPIFVKPSHILPALPQNLYNAYFS